MGEGLLLIVAVVSAWGWWASERRAKLLDGERDALETAQLAADKMRLTPGHLPVEMLQNSTGLTVDDLRSLAALGSRLNVSPTPVRQRFGLKRGAELGPLITEPEPEPIN